jgi:D-sedoheptulose 7-phosphate isomerase
MSSADGFSKAYVAKLSRELSRLPLDQMDQAISLIVEAWHAGRQIIVFGNGGSAMTALHFVTDWNKSVFLAGRRPFRGRSLVDNMGLITAYANDMSYQDVFVEQLKNVLMPGDLVIAISGSGNSTNVIRAVEYANEAGSVTIGLCGFRGGRLKAVARHAIWVDVDDMQIVEDVHAMFGHIVMQCLCGQG